MLQVLGRSSRASLLLAFCGLLGLVAASGADTLMAIRRIRQSQMRIAEQLRQRSATLETVRQGVYLSGMLVGEYLMATDEETAGKQRRQLGSVRRDTVRALEGGPEDLRSDLHVYWKVIELMLGRERESRSAYLSRQLGERRDSMLRITSRLEEEARRERAAAEADIVRMLTDFRWRAGLVLAAALAVGMGLAIFTVRRSAAAEAAQSEFAARLERAQEEERRAIARELHDDVGQALSALLVETGNLTAGGGPNHLDAIRRLADSGLQAVRNLALRLRPSMLDDLGLVPALEWQGREVARRFGLRIEVRAEEAAPELADAQRTCIYRVAQESLTNCARHANAHTVMIELGQSARHVRITIADDGCGFHPSRGRGLGLLGLEERVSRLGGSLRIDSAPGRGARLSVELPLNHATPTNPVS